MGKKVDRAGVIPYIIEQDQIKMLFMKPSNKDYGGDEYQVAKGKKEEGETNEETAFREAGEELGLFEGNILQKHTLGQFLGRTTFFLAKIEDKSLFGDSCDETGSVKWMTPEQFQTEGRNLHKPVVKAAVRMIQDKENLTQ